jgi:RHS repeat-associated protein
MSTSSRVSKTYDSYGNTTSIALYDFGASAPTRKTVLTNFGQSWNGSISSPACTSIGNGVNSVPCQAELFNSAGTPIGNTFYSYGSTGNLTSVAGWASGSITGGVYLTSSNTYNSNGTIATFTDAAGNVSNYTYSPSVCNNGFPISFTSPIASLVTSITWDSGCKGATWVKVTDPNGNSITSVYNDFFWRATKSTDQENNSVNIFYTPTTLESSFSVQSNSSVADVYHQNNPSTLTTYDQQLESPGSTSWDSVVSGWKWDNSGVENYSYLPCVGVKGANCATIGITTTTHDALNRPLVITDGGGGTVTETYAGQDVLTVTGPAPVGEVVKQVQDEYDGLGELVSTCEISNASQPLVNAVSCGQANGGYTGYLTSYTYNSNGTLASVSRSTQTHSFTYDLAGRMLTETYPESGTTTYTYDGSPTCATAPVSGCGQIIKRVDANGNQASYTYDILNRITSIIYTGPNFDGYNQYFVYDKAVVDGVVMPNTKGNLAEAYTATTIHATKHTDEGFGYTARGEMSDVYEYTPSLKGYNHTAATYYANGALNSISGIPGGPWTYSIDGKGRHSGVTNGVSTVLTRSTTYNAADQPVILTYGSGDTDNYTYDPFTGRIIGYTFTLGATPVTNSGALTWNINGTLRSLLVTDGINVGGTQTCNYGTPSTPGYDASGRLLSIACVNGNMNLWSQNFSYDVFNNITKIVPSGTYTYTPTTWNPGYNSSTNRPNGTTSDANGNLLTDTFHTYTWNQNNKVIGVTDAGISATYDAFGQMVEKYNGSTYTQPILSPIGNLGLWNGKSSVNQFRIPLPGGATAVTGINFWHKDWLGSVRLVSGLTSRNSITDKAFAPYGETYAVFPSGNTTDLNFTGDNQDLVAGMYDTPSRELNPNQGRWISPDPAHSGWNAYAYSTNPLGTTDSSGNQNDQVDSGTSIQGPPDPLLATGTTFVANIDCAGGSCVVTSISSVNSPSFGVSEYAQTWDFGPGLEGVQDVLVPAQLESAITSVGGAQNENGGLVSQNENIVFFGGGLLNNITGEAANGTLMSLLSSEEGILWFSKPASSAFKTQVTSEDTAKLQKFVLDNFRAEIAGPSGWKYAGGASGHCCDAATMFRDYLWNHFKIQSEVYQVTAREGSEYYGQSLGLMGQHNYDMSHWVTAVNGYAYDWTQAQYFFRPPVHMGQFPYVWPLEQGPARIPWFRGPKGGRF